MPRSLSSEFVQYEMDTARVVMVAIPTFGTVSYAWHQHMMQLQNPMNRSVAHYAIGGQEVGDARNLLVDYALKFQHSNGWTASHVFFVDDDTLIPSNALLKLLAHKRPIVSGLYFTKTDPAQPLMLGGDQGGVIDRWAPNSVVECRVHGMGCTLIEIGVFKALIEQQLVEQGLYYEEGQPKDIWRFFATTRDAQRETEDGMPTLYNETEDAYFLKRAAKLGYQPAVDTSILCWHWDNVKKQAYPLPQWIQHRSGQPVDWSMYAMSEAVSA